MFSILQSSFCHLIYFSSLFYLLFMLWISPINYLPHLFVYDMDTIHNWFLGKYIFLGLKPAFVKKFGLKPKFANKYLDLAGGWIEKFINFHTKLACKLQWYIVPSPVLCKEKRSAKTIKKTITIYSLPANKYSLIFNIFFYVNLSLVFI